MKKITLLAALFAVFSMNAQLLTENFDDITTLTDYTFLNVSDSPGADYFQGNPASFEAYEGAPDSYIGVNFQSTSGVTGTETISNWMFLPTLNLENGDILTFYSRIPTVGTTEFPDRLEIRVSPDGSDTQPTTPTDVGSYTELLGSINPTLVTGVYPQVWTEFSFTVTGLTGATDTRLAIRYFVTNGGPNGANSNYVGIDSLVVEEPIAAVGDNAFNSFTYFVDSRNQLNLRANTPMENVKLYNVLGQQVVSQKLVNSSETINISSLNSGVYIAMVTIDGQNKSFKIVKK